MGDIINAEGVDQNKIWVICQKQHFLFDEFKRAGYIVFDPFIGCNSIVPRFFRIFHFKSKIPNKKIWYRELPKVMPKIVILREGIANEDYLRWLRNKLPNTLIIGLFMNKIRSTEELDLLRKYNCQPSTGDPEDCIKYNISSQYSAVYLRHFVVNKKNIDCDVFYIGSAKKGREEALFDIRNQLENQGLKVNTYLTSPLPYGITLGKYERHLPYNGVLEKLGNCKAILHLSLGASSGITFRVMESVINRIKLITDDKSIIETEVYNPNNIFVIGVDDFNMIKEFIRKPFIDINKEVVEKFYFSSDIKKLLES